jgi:hypothetical protein
VPRSAIGQPPDDYRRYMTSVRRRSVALLAGCALAATGSAVGLTPPTTAEAATSGPALTVDVAVRGPVISPDMYGASFPTAAFAAAAHISLARWGGNSTTRYDYRTDDYNTANDWYFENHSWEGGKASSGGRSALDTFVVTAGAASRRSAVTVPVLGWVAKDATSCSFPTSVYGAQQSTDYWQPTCGNGSTPSGSPLHVSQSATTTGKPFGPSDITTMAAHLAARTAAAAPTTIYQLDNEPSLWNSTHRDVQPTGIAATTLFAKSIAAADAVVAGDPHGIVAGPGDWGWCAYFYYPADGCSSGADRAAHGGLDLAAAYLRAFHDHDLAVGHRTLSVLDEHFYPQGDGIALTTAGSAATQALRLRSTRGLWDPTYRDESWIATVGVNEHVMLIPRMKAWVTAYYPGTALAIGEYNFGGLESINGALAQADTLGILGREGVRWAALWSPPDSASAPGTFAFRMFRNLDGHGAGFGTQSVRASSSDQGRLSTYAATRADGTLTVVVVNKTGGALTSPLTVTGMAPTGTATAYTYSAADTSRIVTSHVAVGRTTSLTFPANSITTLVVPRATTASSLTLTVSAHAVTFPTRVVLTARLTSAGAAVAGAPVALYARARGSIAWHLVDRRATDARGYASVGVTPSAHTEFSVRDLRAASGSVSPAPAASARGGPVLVRRSTTLTLSPSTVHRGAVVRMTGRVSPGAAGRTVTAQRLVGRAWTVVATGRVTGRSMFALTVRPTSPGSTTYRVVVAGDSGHLAAVSAPHAAMVV